jgi:hypothetical protein
MSMEKYAELNLYRARGIVHTFTADGPFNWVPERDGCLLKLDAGAGGPWTVTLSVTLPTAPTLPTGMRLWVEFYQGGAGGSLITWPGSFQFQTAGDQIPNAGVANTTIWTGIFGVGSSNCYMTKLGEW